MLKDLRKNEFMSSLPWKKEIQKGKCANKDCFEIAVKRCSNCGLGYCCVDCRANDWKFRHERFCKKTDILATKRHFIKLNLLLKDYQNGKTSWHRYTELGDRMSYLEVFPLSNKDNLLDDTHYRIIDERNGRLLTVLEDHEEKSIFESHPNTAICRGGSLYLVNRTVPTRNFENFDKKIIELVPLNEKYQNNFRYRMAHSQLYYARRSMYFEGLKLLSIQCLIQNGMGYLYANPVFLSLDSFLAYEG